MRKKYIKIQQYVKNSLIIRKNLLKKFGVDGKKGLNKIFGKKEKKKESNQFGVCHEKYKIYSLIFCYALKIIKT